MLKKVVVGLGLVLVAFFVVALLMPSKWHVERTVTIAAPGQRILPLLSSLRRWQDWAAWNRELDPQAAWSYSEPDVGVGAHMEWNGPKMGTGKLTIVESDYRTGLRYEMVMEHGTPAKGRFAFVADGANTKVTWTDEGEMGMNLVGRFFVSMIETQLGEHFEIGLGKLKALAEADQKGAEAAAAQAEKARAEAQAAGPVPAATPAGEVRPGASASIAP